MLSTRRLEGRPTSPLAALLLLAAHAGPQVAWLGHREPLRLYLSWRTSWMVGQKASSFSGTVGGGTIFETAAFR